MDQFQKVHELLEVGEVRSALEALLDVREQGFVNKELDATINVLRDDPSAHAIDEARSWAQLVIGKLESYGGDVFHLVEEFSEASLGLSEADWVPVSNSFEFDEADFETPGAGDDDFDMLEIDDDSDFDFDFDDGADFDLDFEDEPVEPIEGVESVPKLSGDGDSWTDEDADPPSIDFALVESSVVSDEPPVEVGAEESSELDLFEEDEEEEGDTSGHGFVQEPTRRSDSLDDLLSNGRRRGPSLSEESDEEEEEDEDEFDFDLGFENPESRTEVPTRESEITSSHVDEEEEDEFDFDLGFENPESQTETPAHGMQAEPVEPPDEEEEDEFDFDLGFENPESRTETPAHGMQAEPVEPVEPPDEEEEDEFDFDLGFENPAEKIEPAQPDSPLGRADSSGTLSFDFRLEDASESEGFSLEEATPAGEAAPESPQRSSQPTPTQMSSVPRFRSPIEEEETSPRSEEPENQSAESLDDDAFFQLAESLAADSAAEEDGSAGYRGEPMMSQGEPTGAGDESSAVFEQSEDPNRSNPFAHEAPTGVQEALVDSQSSFVLEEIRDSEASDDQAALGALMTEARRLYEKGSFQSARDLLEAVLDRSADHEEANELMATVEGELEREHQSKIGSLSKVPELQVSMSEIPNLNLDHRFGFLLSQIDGMSSFEDILELSSMSRRETLEVLTEMLDRDIISI